MYVSSDLGICGGRVAGSGGGVTGSGIGLMTLITGGTASLACLSRLSGRNCPVCLSLTSLISGILGAGGKLGITGIGVG